MTLEMTYYKTYMVNVDFKCCVSKKDVVATLQNQETIMSKCIETEYVVRYSRYKDIVSETVKIYVCPFQMNVDKVSNNLIPPLYQVKYSLPVICTS